MRILAFRGETVMKKLCLFFAVIMILLTSCSFTPSHIRERFFDNDAQIANNHFEKLINAIQSQDKDALQSLFSRKAISEADNFDESMVALFDFFQGEMLSYDDFGAHSSDSGMNNGDTKQIWKAIQSTYDVVTDKQTYRIAIKEFIEDTENEDNVGIYSLSVIRKEDSDLQFSYWGNYKWEPGITIDSKDES